GRTRSIMRARVICISRAVAAGGETVGKLVSTNLGFQYVDEEILAVAAENAHAHPRLVAEAEHRQSLLSRILDAIAEPPAVPASPSSYFTPAPGTGTDDARDTGAPLGKLNRDAKELIREAIVEVASRGRVVIVAHAASFALAHVPGVLRVLVTASE